MTEQENKPDFALIEIGTTHSENNAFERGCDYVWSTYVVPLQEENKKLKGEDTVILPRAKYEKIVATLVRQRDTLSDEKSKLESENKSLKESLHAAERLRASDAMSALDEANFLRKTIESLRDEVERLKAFPAALDKYNENKAYRFPSVQSAFRIFIMDGKLDVKPKLNV